MLGDHKNSWHRNHRYMCVDHSNDSYPRKYMDTTRFPGPSTNNYNNKNYQGFNYFKKVKHIPTKPYDALTSKSNSNKQDNSKKRDVYLKAFSKKVTQSDERKVDFSAKKMSSKMFNTALSVNMPIKEETVQSLDSFQHIVQSSTSDSVLCYVCNELVPSVKLYKHLLFGNVKCKDCEIEFNCCEEYQLLNSPKASFIPSICLHNNLIFVNAIDFMKIIFSGSGSHIIEQVLDFIKSCSSVKNVNPYMLAIKECNIKFRAETIKSNTIIESACDEFLSKSQLSADTSKSDIVICCYVCHENVLQSSFYKHLWFGTLKCQDCNINITTCMEYQNDGTNKNSFTPLCLHKNSIFIDPTYFLKSNFFGPNSRKNKLLLEYAKSIISIKKQKPYYYLAFKEFKKLCSTASSAISVIERDDNNSIKETYNNIEHIPNVSVSNYSQDDGVLDKSLIRQSGETIKSLDSFQSHDQSSSSDSILCYMCFECVPSFKLNKHLLFGNVKCKDCEIEFMCCEEYQKLNSPKTSFIPSMCLHKNLIFVDAVDFMQGIFSDSEQFLDYNKSLSSIKKLNPYDLAIIKCRIFFQTITSKIIKSDITNTDTKSKSVCDGLLSKEQLSSGVICCYVCHEIVPQSCLYKHLWFGTLKCQDCETNINTCLEYQKLNTNKNNFTPSCLHKNSLFVDPIYFLKSNFLGPNSRKNKLLLEYSKSIISIRKIKSYYYLAFKEFKKLRRSIENVTPFNENDKGATIKEKNHEIKHATNLSISKYDNDDDEKHYLNLPADGNYLIIHKTIEKCPMCYRRLRPENSIYSLTLWIYTFICRCKLIIYYIPKTPAGIKHPVWVEEF